MRGASLRTHQRATQSGGYLDAPEPEPIALPVAPRGRAPKPAELSGAWRGPLTLYPSPATIEVRFDRSGGATKAHLRVSFEPPRAGGAKRDDVVAADLPVEFDEGGLAFVDPKGPQQGRVRYRGALVDGALSGLAEFVVAPEHRFYGIGTWKLTKVP